MNAIGAANADTVAVLILLLARLAQYPPNPGALALDLDLLRLLRVDIP